MSGVTHGSFTIAREYDAPVAMVFKAWADPAAKARWFLAPVPLTDVIRQQDFRVGGRDRYKGTWPEHFTSDFNCEYLDIVENARIVYVYDMHLDGKKISVSLATILFEKSGKGTRMTVTEQGVFLDGYVDGGSRERGTSGLIDQLGRSLAPN
ncbi:MAG TPA: SRPBCC family protein [Rhizomicrobium sp.]|nr:SRPBCC family protein [Rhizomicrobium sp.]